MYSPTSPLADPEGFQEVGDRVGVGRFGFLFLVLAVESASLLKEQFGDALLGFQPVCD